MFVANSLSRELSFWFFKAPEKEFFIVQMSKIKEYYLNKASYIAIDENGKRIDIEIDYWGNKYGISENNKDLLRFAGKLLKKKHRVNFVHKMLE